MLSWVSSTLLCCLALLTGRRQSQKHPWKQLWVRLMFLLGSVWQQVQRLAVVRRSADWHALVVMLGVAIKPAEHVNSMLIALMAAELEMATQMQFFD